MERNEKIVYREKYSIWEKNEMLQQRENDLNVRRSKLLEREAALSRRESQPKVEEEQVNSAS